MPYDSHVKPLLLPYTAINGLLLLCRRTVRSDTDFTHYEYLDEQSAKHSREKQAETSTLQCVTWNSGKARVTILHVVGGIKKLKGAESLDVKLLVAQLTLYGTWRFITVFTRARYWVLSTVRRTRPQTYTQFLQHPFQYYPPIILCCLTLRSCTLLVKLIVAQSLSIFSLCFGTPRFITVFTRACQWSLSWARSIRSTCRF
jgi:hypothetical protein